MSKGSNDIVTFLLGAVIGVGAGFYLNSKKGKKLRKKAAHKISDLEHTVEDKVNSAYEKLKDQVNTAADKIQDKTEA